MMTGHAFICAPLTDSLPVVSSFPPTGAEKGEGPFTFTLNGIFRWTPFGDILNDHRFP